MSLTTTRVFCVCCPSSFPLPPRMSDVSIRGCCCRCAECCLVLCGAFPNVVWCVVRLSPACPPACRCEGGGAVTSSPGFGVVFLPWLFSLLVCVCVCCLVGHRMTCSLAYLTVGCVSTGRLCLAFVFACLLACCPPFFPLPGVTSCCLSSHSWLLLLFAVHLLCVPCLLGRTLPFFFEGVVSPTALVCRRSGWV